MQVSAPHANAIDIYYCYRYINYIIGYFLHDLCWLTWWKSNIFRCLGIARIHIKGWSWILSTQKAKAHQDPVMDDPAKESHQGSTDGLHSKWSTPWIQWQMTHWKMGHNKDPLMDEASMYSELHCSYIICAAWCTCIGIFWYFHALIIFPVCHSVIF